MISQNGLGEYGLVMIPGFMGGVFGGMDCDVFMIHRIFIHLGSSG
jgi:hypothetical protein